MLKRKEIQVDDKIMCLDDDICTEGCFYVGTTYKISHIQKNGPMVTNKVRRPAPPQLYREGQTMPVTEAPTKKVKEPRSNISHVTLICEGGCEHQYDFFTLKQYFHIPNITIRDLPAWWLV